MVLSEERMKLKAPATAIHHYDIVIIGGGIAGIAIAELLSRKTNLSIKVIDHAPQLGTGASGKLEGWFHSGALYSGNDDAQTFMNCINGIEDLINHYSTYSDGRCNMVLQGKQPNLFAPAVIPHEDGWFNAAPVFYILPNQESPDIKFSRFKNDSLLWEIQRQRVFNRMEAAFGLQHNWFPEGQCRAPSYRAIESYRGEACSLQDQSGILDALCKRYGETFGLNSSPCNILKSLDVSMNTAAIMRDLVASGISKGVDFETGINIENLVIDRFGPIRIKSLLCRDPRGVMHHLKARLFVFAVGSGFKTLLQQLHVRVRLKMSKSAMVVASPPLCRINFARMSIKDKFHFNHLVHQAKDKKSSSPYSMLGNSASSQDEADVEQDVVDVDYLLDAAERCFGKKELYSRKLYFYDCIKTEFLSDEEEKRRYSYWIEWNRDSNYLSVLPGKFSFFPTVAYQTYLKIKKLLELKEYNNGSNYISDEKAELEASCLVADHYPVRIFSENTASQRGSGKINSKSSFPSHTPMTRRTISSEA